MALFSTLYGHGVRGSVQVRVGQILKDGDRIFQQGNTGISDGPHLHITRIPGERATHWSGYQTIGLGGTEADILSFIRRAPIYDTKVGRVGHNIPRGGEWYGYPGHGAIDTVSEVGTNRGGIPWVVWNQPVPGKVIGVHDYGSDRTGVTVIVLTGYEDAAGSATGGSSESYTIQRGDTLWGITGGDQARIEQILEANPGLDVYNLQPGQSISFKRSLKTVDVLAKEVIKGVWGTGTDRKKRIEAAGYDYIAVQKMVNTILDNLPSLREGDTVKVRPKSTDYKGEGLADFVYQLIYEVIQVDGNRIVIGKNGEITAAMNKDRLYRV